jgi:hypothetical protein
MLHVQNFYQPHLTQLTWTAHISEYDTVPAGANPFKIRIEFNSVGFMGSSGILYVGAMIQDVGHTFPDDAYGSATTFPAVGLYFSSFQSNLSDSQNGVALNATPTVYPLFGRIFENIDQLGGSSGKNIYTRENLGIPMPTSPIVVQWVVTKRDTVTNPVGNYSKDLNGNWVPLSGTFVRWNFSVLINGVSYDVADYYLPIGYAEYILASDPLVLHQEYFGSATQILYAQKCTVRYTDLRVFDGSAWYPLENWAITWRIDDGAGNLDNRFGWRSDGVSLTSTVGHDDDVTLSYRDVGHKFSVIPAGSSSPIPFAAIQTIVPHSAYGAGWISHLFVANLTNSANTVTINRIDQSGNIVNSSTSTLAAGGTEEMSDPESNRALPLTINWFAIGSQGPVIASVLFDFQGAAASTPANYNTAIGALASPPLAAFTAIARVTSPGGDLGLALANLNNASNTVTIKLYDEGGNLVAQDAVTLGAYAQTAFDLTQAAAFKDILASTNEFVGTLTATTSDPTKPVSALVVGANLNQLFSLPVVSGVAQ